MEKTTYSNYFMKEIESKYVGKNIFKKFISYIRHKKFIHTIRTWSPSIGVLWFFADFIKTAERVYFYDNRRDGELFSSNTGYGIGENGFIINSSHDKVKITCKLYSDAQKVTIEVKRLNGSNITTEHIFEDNQWTYNMKEYDEVLIDNIIGIINRNIIDIVEFCWDHKGSYDYGITKKEKALQRKNKTQLK